MLGNPYQYALLMNNFKVLAEALSTFFIFHFSRKISIHKYLPFKQVMMDKNALQRGQFFFLMFFFVSLFILANTEFGVVNWLLNPRMGYQIYRSGQGHWYALAVSSLSVSFILALLAQPTSDKIIMNTTIYLILGLLLGAKGILLSIFVTMIIFLWFVRSRYLGLLIFIGVPMIIAIMVLSLTFNMESDLKLESIFNYFDHYQNAALYYDSYLKGEVKLFYGDVLLSSFWSYVPRGLWPDKPWVYGTLLVNEIFYIGQAEKTNTPAFGGAVPEFADFGLIGVIVYGLFSIKGVSMGLLSYLIFRNPELDFNRITLATVLLVIMQYAPYFGTFMPGMFYLLFLFTVLFLLKMLRRRSIHSSIITASLK